ncbi:MAG: response regulator [Candidatus Gastranaerophilales bacterium]|nr:response regulator [Candidatus Gastranaerophilales bacterium]
MYKSKKILILDDEKIATSTLKTLLSLEGFSDVNCFNSPLDAIAFLKEAKPDLIISDFKMPDMNGLEFLTEAKNLCPDACKILLTGYADKENAIRAINEVGLYKYIEKPWQNDDLLINIKNGLEKCELVSALKEKVEELNKANSELEKYSNHLEEMVKARTAELTEANSKLNAIISNCADGIVLISEDNKIVSVNNAAETMFGLAETMIQKMDLDELFSSETDQFSELLKNTDNSGIIRDIFVKNAVNGNNITADISYAKIEPVNYYVCVVRDVSAQKEAQRLREDFIATLTHDLRTPLLAAIQTLKYFTDGSLGELTEKQNLLLSTMLQSNKDMLGLVNALLEVYKYESGTIPINKADFAPNDLVNQCCDEIESLAKSKNIELIRELDSTNDIEINADRNEIRRVMMNLLGNAVNYTEENGKILVKSNLNGNDYMFSVKDNGIGISHDDINKMFKRFSQGTKNRRSASTGLGLYLSKQIIEAHGGKIWLESVQNKGSEFFFLLLDAALLKNKV